MVKSIPSTAFTQAKILEKKIPFVRGKYFVNFSTVKIASDIMPAPYKMIPRKLHLWGGCQGALVELLGATREKRTARRKIEQSRRLPLDTI
jgi:hypothetical protein